jgi:hypothetical protein
MGMASGQRRGGAAIQSRWQLPAIFAFGVIFLAVMLGIAIFQPNPTPFSRLIFGLVAALAGGAIAALIPGAFSIELPVQIRAGGAIGVTALVFFVFWQGFPNAQVVRPPLPNGIETGWIFVGYVDKNSGGYTEGPYVGVTNTNQKLREKYVEAGDEIVLKVDRELIITDYKNGGGNAFKSPTEIPGGSLRPADRTGFNLPKGSEWIVRDVVLAGFLQSASDANWIRISEIPH